MRLRWMVIALYACGDSTKAPVAPIVVADIAPATSASAAPSPQPVAETAPAPAASATEDEPATGNMWGDSIGDSAAGDAGTPASAHKTKSPTLRQLPTTVNGKLPPEVIQRIVRQNFGRFRLCYENGLRTNPKLGGRITAKFTITSSGAVGKTADAGSDLPDKSVIACVVKGYANMSFPQPTSGEVIVTYGILFSPGD